MADSNVVAFPSPPPRRWATEPAASGCVVSIDPLPGVTVDRAALVAQIHDLAETIAGPLGRAFFGEG